MNGWIFDIGEATIHDGPGLRVTVFFKGCPLRCRWCHSPEGQHSEPEMLRLPTGDRLCGERREAGELAHYLEETAKLLGPSGGITFSGGDPLMQPEFLLEVLRSLPGIHTIVETSGFCRPSELLRVAEHCSLIHYGLKLIDETTAKEWTGVSSRQILKTLRALDHFSGGAEYIFRLPLLAGITDTEENLRNLMQLSRTLHRLRHIDFLPANTLASAKYTACGRTFDPVCANNATGMIPAWFAPGVPWKILK